MIWRIASLLIISLAFTTAHAAERVPAPLQQDVDYTQEISASLYDANFSTDVREGRVAAEIFENAPDPGDLEDLDLEIINRKTCADAGYHLTYRIVLRNRGEEDIENIIIQNKYPEGTVLTEEDTRPLGEHNQEERLIIWRVNKLVPGQYTDFVFTLQVTTPGVLKNEVTVKHGEPAGVPARPGDRTPPTRASLGPAGSPEVPEQPTGTILTDHTIYGECTVETGAVVEQDTNADEFSIVLLPDTQKYARFYPATFAAQTQWIVDNAARDKEDIRFVGHEGDIVDKNTKPEWEVAIRSMRVMDDVVPYAVAPGNHDMGPESFEVSATTRDTTLYNKYFPVSRYRNMETFEGVFEPGKYDNNYHAFKAGGVDWLVLSLEFGPRDTVLAWANEVVKNHANHRVIVVTHNYLSSEGNPTRGNVQRYGLANQPEGANDGEQMWQKFIKNHPNIMFVFSGHVKADGKGRRVATGDHGNKVYEMVANFQFEEQGGNGYLRIVKINTREGTVDVRTFSPLLGIDRPGDQHDFEFEDVDFGLPDPADTLPNGADPVPVGPRDQEAIPAILCDVSLIDCNQFLPSLSAKFTRAQPAIVCSENDPRGCTPNIPLLGARFAEAIADIIPGDCRVIEDDIIRTPEYQDAFNRRASAAAFHLGPAQGVSELFEQVVHENRLLGLRHQWNARDKLREIHVAFFNEVQTILQNALEDENSNGGNVISQIESVRNSFLGKVREEQQKLRPEYVNLQQIKKRRVANLLPEVVAGARRSIERACAGEDRPDGSEAAFQAASNQYNTVIDNLSIPGYDRIQNTFQNPNSGDLEQGIRASEFDALVQQAMAAHANGNSQPLVQLIGEIPQREKNGFNAAFAQTYERHIEFDTTQDNIERTLYWEPSLDNAKSIANQCAIENISSASAHTSWCESNNYGQFIIHGAPQPAREGVQPILPPNTGDLNGPAERVNQSQNTGVACSGLPGDPYWAANCSCKCGDVIPDGEGEFTSCQRENPITRGDITITSPAECLLQATNHEQLTF